MNKIKQAEKDFENLGFHITNYIPYKPPINNLQEIQKIKQELSKPLDNKSKEIFEMLLEEQTQPQEEYLESIKFINEEKFNPENLPYIMGYYFTKNSDYELTFIPRLNEESKFKPKTLDLELFATEDQDLSNALKNHLNQRKKKINFPENVNIEIIGKCNIQINPPIIKTKNQNLNKAYSDLVSVIKSFGYNIK